MYKKYLQLLSGIGMMQLIQCESNLRALRRHPHPAKHLIHRGVSLFLYY